MTQKLNVVDDVSLRIQSLPQEEIKRLDWVPDPLDSRRYYISVSEICHEGIKKERVRRASNPFVKGARCIKCGTIKVLEAPPINTHSNFHRRKDDPLLSI